MQSTLQSTASAAGTLTRVAISCRICGNSEANATHRVREMMFGFGEEFNYMECSHCGCLQLVQVPDNPARYYGQKYYAYRDASQNPLKAFLRRRVVEHVLGRRNLIGMILLRCISAPNYCDWFRRCSVTWDSAILDVGCGTGGRILKMHSDGFSNLTGIDPYLEGDILYDGGPRIYKRRLHEFDGRFDFIMLHHSFEHMENPVGVMNSLYRLLDPAGYVLIRIPVAGSYAWHKYGVNWVQLDAPRHCFLHTPRSMAVLAEQAGFRIADVVYDSCEFQFWGSEQYKHGIVLTDARSYSVNPRKSIFSKAQIRAFRSQSETLNKKKEGDSVCFYLRRK